jgi:hypothetical protein
MTSKALPPHNDAVADPVSDYRQHRKRARIEGALLTLLALSGCLGLMVGCYLAWDILAANGELRVIPLFAVSFCFLLIVVHRLGRTAEPVWVEKLGDVQVLAATRERKPR